MFGDGHRPRALVTGVAGFIGSHLAERLLARGYEVIGVDCFTDYYARSLKERNLADVMGRAGPQRAQPGHFQFVEADLCTAELASLLEGVNYVFHQAAQAGVRTSWGEQFDTYVRDNIMATQRLLEASLPFLAAENASLQRVILASSSSVYGNSEDLPLRESSPCRPYSPYGVTKLAAENLGMLYYHNFGVPVIILRYFTVYGPRQRPDMAFHRFLKAIFSGEPITVYGDGEQTRDYTYITDAVEANLLACHSSAGRVYNIGGGSRVTVNEVIRMMEEITGIKATVKYVAPQYGDVRHTWADTSLARRELGFRPRVNLREGLRAQIAWLRELYDFDL